MSDGMMRVPVTKKWTNRETAKEMRDKLGLLGGRLVSKGANGKKKGVESVVKKGLEVGKEIRQLRATEDGSSDGFAELMLRMDREMLKENGLNSDDILWGNDQVGKSPKEKVPKGKEEEVVKKRLPVAKHGGYLVNDNGTITVSLAQLQAKANEDPENYTQIYLTVWMLANATSYCNSEERGLAFVVDRTLGFMKDKKVGARALHDVFTGNNPLTLTLDSIEAGLDVLEISMLEQGGFQKRWLAALAQLDESDPARAVFEALPGTDDYTNEALYALERYLGVKEAELQALFEGEKPSVTDINRRIDELLGLDKANEVLQKLPIGVRKATVLKIALALMVLVGIGVIAYNFEAIRASVTHGHPVGGGHAGNGPPIYNKPPVDTLPPIKHPTGGGDGFGLHHGIWGWGQRQT